jgi:NAD+ diphosphatase
MVGCFGRAKDGQTIRLDLDNELEGALTPNLAFQKEPGLPARPLMHADAQWFPRDQIAALVGHPSGSHLSKSDLKQLDNKGISEQETANALAPAERQPGEAPPEGAIDEGLTRVPPGTAIAGQLIRVWAAGELELVGKL